MSETLKHGIGEPFLAEMEGYLHAKLPFNSREWEYGRRLVNEVRELNKIIAADRALMRKSSVAIENLLDAITASFDNRHFLPDAIERASKPANTAMNDLWNMAEHGEVI